MLGCSSSGISKTSPTSTSSLISAGLSSSMITLAGSMQQPMCQRQTSLQALFEGRILGTSRGLGAHLVSDTGTTGHGKGASTADESSPVTYGGISGSCDKRRHQHTTLDHQPSTAQLAALAIGKTDGDNKSNNQHHSHHHSGVSNESGGSSAQTTSDNSGSTITNAIP